METYIEERVTARAFWPSVVVDRIIERIAGGGTIAEFAADAGMPSKAPIYLAR
ncbi:hypothetical protein [Pararobbsia alpina]|uniref:hypothetical protein n=1 Tax=Pararobbsia alpina TaxID=621374 RepID=UPI0039A5D953